MNEYHEMLSIEDANKYIKLAKYLSNSILNYDNNKNELDFKILIKKIEDFLELFIIDTIISKFKLDIVIFPSTNKNRVNFIKEFKNIGNPLDIKYKMIQIVQFDANLKEYLHNLHTDIISESSRIYLNILQSSKFNKLLAHLDLPIIIQQVLKTNEGDWYIYNNINNKYLELCKNIPKGFEDFIINCKHPIMLFWVKSTDRFKIVIYIENFVNYDIKINNSTFKYHDKPVYLVLNSREDSLQIYPLNAINIFKTLPHKGKVDGNCLQTSEGVGQCFGDVDNIYNNIINNFENSSKSEEGINTLIEQYRNIHSMPFINVKDAWGTQINNFLPKVIRDYINLDNLSIKKLNKVFINLNTQKKYISFIDKTRCRKTIQNILLPVCRFVEYSPEISIPKLLKDKHVGKDFKLSKRRKSWEKRLLTLIEVYNRYEPIYRESKKGTINNIVIVGLGSLGGYIAKELVYSKGTENIKINLVDFDRVQLHNTDNQIYTGVHVERSKVYAIQNILHNKCLEKNIEIIPNNCSFDYYVENYEQGQIDENTLVIMAVDAMEPRFSIHNFCNTKKAIVINTQCYTNNLRITYDSSSDMNKEQLETVTNIDLPDMQTNPVLTKQTGEEVIRFLLKITNLKNVEELFTTKELKNKIGEFMDCGSTSVFLDESNNFKRIDYSRRY